MLSGLIFLGMFILGANHAQYGISFIDEGLYLSTPLRYTLGDTPFRDELLTAAIPFDKLTQAVFWWLPEITLFEFRLLGLALIMFSLFLFYLVLRKFVSSVFASLVCLFMFSINNFFGILSPAYDLLSSALSLGSLSFLLLSKEVLAGLFLGLCIFVYPPSFILLLFLFAFTIITKQHRLSLLSALLTLGLIVLVIFLSSQFPFLLYGLKVQGILRLNMQQSLIHVLLLNIREYAHYLFSLARMDTTANFQYQMIAFFMLTGFVLLGKSLLLKSRTAWDKMVVLVAIWSIVFTLTVQLTSANVYYKGMQALIPVVGISLAAFYRIFRKYKHLLIPYLIILLFLSRSLPFYLNTIYGDEKRQKLTSALTQQKLRGVKTSSLRKERLERLLNYLEPLLKRGDYLLAYNNLPLLYYLTDTRSSLALSWIEEPFWPLEVRKQLLKDMLERKRSPEYVVRMLTTSIEGEWPTTFNCEGLRCPLDKYVIKNYHLIKVLYPFQIWGKVPARFRIKPLRDSLVISSQSGKQLRLEHTLPKTESRNLTLYFEARLIGTPVELATFYLKSRGEYNSCYILSNNWEKYGISITATQDTPIKYGIIWNPQNPDARVELRQISLGFD